MNETIGAFSDCANCLVSVLQKVAPAPQAEAQLRAGNETRVVDLQSPHPCEQSCSSEAASDLIEALRAELLQCCEVLACLDDLEAHQAQGDRQEVRLQVEALQEQEKTVEQALQRREEARRHVARHLSLSEEASLTGIIPFLSRHHQLLVEALMEENGRLRARIQRQAKLNN